jgi:transposase
LDYQPASLFVRRRVRPKYACGRCPGGVVAAPPEPQPIAKGLPGPGLLAQVLVSKYADHVPLYRLERILSRHGVDLSRSTLCGWVAACADLLTPLYDLMVTAVLASKKIHCDDTPVRLHRSGTRQGHVWVYLGDDAHPYTVYDFRPNHARDGPVTFLRGFNGYLQADAYAGYHDLYARGVTEVACWAHARRYFIDAMASDPAAALEAVAHIRGLYAVERQARDRKPAERWALRQTDTVPQLAAFRSWLETHRRVTVPKSPLGQAIAYALSNWAALERYTADGDLSIDNNPAERALRGIGVGRRYAQFRAMRSSIRSVVKSTGHFHIS